MSARNKLWKFFDLVGSATFDPYGYNYATKKRINVLANEYNGEIARLTVANIAVNASFSSNMVEAMRNARKPPNMTNAAERGAEQKASPQERLPWNLNVYYNLTIDKIITVKPKFVQSLNFNGDINVTKFWKLGVTSGYDFTNKRLSYTSVNVYRDLKCWEARIDLSTGWAVIILWEGGLKDVEGGKRSILWLLDRIRDASAAGQALEWPTSEIR